MRRRSAARTASSITTRRSRASTPRTRCRWMSTIRQRRRRTLATAFHGEYAGCASRFAMPIRRPGCPARTTSTASPPMASRATRTFTPALTLENRAAEATGTTWSDTASHASASRRSSSSNVGTPITYNFGTVPCSAPTADCFTEYFGNVVTIRGANGYTATGQASFFLPDRQSGFQSRRAVLPDRLQLCRMAHGAVRLPLRERARQLCHRDFDNEKIQRTNFEYTLQFQGDIKSRLFYSAGGGDREEPSLRHHGHAAHRLCVCSGAPGEWFHGTLLRANGATGVQEPTLALSSPACTRNCSSRRHRGHCEVHVAPPGPRASRTYDGGVDQNIKGRS